jgi:hypothetical protein
VKQTQQEAICAAICLIHTTRVSLIMETPEWEVAWGILNRSSIYLLKQLEGGVQ